MNKLFLACMLSFTIAQNDSRGDFDQDNWSNDGTTRSERRESMVIWRLTEDLDLSSEQAEKFFPEFRSHREDIQKIRIQLAEEYGLLVPPIHVRDNLNIRGGAYRILIRGEEVAESEVCE